MRGTASVRIVAAALAVALCVTACGDDDDPAANGSDPGAEVADDTDPTGDETGPDGGDGGEDDGEGPRLPDDVVEGTAQLDPDQPEAPSDGPVDPGRLAVDAPRLAERLCAVDPRVVLASAPSDPEAARELLDATRDPLAELQSALREVAGGDELAALVDRLIGRWTAAVTESDAGNGGAAGAALDEAAGVLAELHDGAETVLASCGPR